MDKEKYNKLVASSKNIIKVNSWEYHNCNGNAFGKAGLTCSKVIEALMHFDHKQWVDAKIVCDKKNFLSLLYWQSYGITLQHLSNVEIFDDLYSPPYNDQIVYCVVYLNDNMSVIIECLNR